MTPPPSLFPPKVAAVLGVLGLIVLSASPFVPVPWAIPVGLVGFLAASLAGLSAKPPGVVEGAPVLQGGALTASAGLLALLIQFYPVIPVGWPQAVALGAAGLLAWATGKALPALGTPSAPALPPPASDPLRITPAPTSPPAAADVFNAGPGPNP